MTASGDKGITFDANDLLKVVRKLQEEGKTSLLRTFFYLIRALEVDFSQVRTPSSEELRVLSEVSPLCERLVKAYTELIAKARREVAEGEPDLDDTR